MHREASRAGASIFDRGRSRNVALPRAPARRERPIRTQLSAQGRLRGYFLYGVHDGTVSENNVADVGSTTPASSVGLMLWGDQNITVTGNHLAGGTGDASIGIDVRPYASELPLPDSGITLSGNTIGAFSIQVVQQ